MKLMKSNLYKGKLKKNEAVDRLGYVYKKKCANCGGVNKTTSSRCEKCTKRKLLD